MQILLIKGLLSSKSMLSDRVVIRKSKHLYLNLPKLAEELDSWLESKLMSPIVPEKMEKFWREQLMLEGIPSETGLWSDEYSFPTSHKVGEASPLYERIDIDKIEKYKEELV